MHFFSTDYRRKKRASRQEAQAGIKAGLALTFSFPQAYPSSGSGPRVLPGGGASLTGRPLRADA